jgi:hypothetical protein
VSTTSRLSPLRRARALQTLCSVLAGSSTRRDQVGAKAFGDVVRVASDYRLAASLCLALESAGLAEVVAASDVRALRWAWRRTALSAGRFQCQLGEAVGALGDAGIDALVLKGGVLLAEVEGWPLSSEDVVLARAREMSDLDVCVAPADYGRAADVLTGLGYERAPLWRFEPDHATTFAREGEVGTIDLHHALGVSEARQLLPFDDVLARSLRATVLDSTCRVLAPADALVHDIVHSELADLNYRIGGLPLRQIYSFTQLYARWASPEVWREVCQRLDSAGHGRVLAAHCELVRSMFGADIDMPARTIAARRHLARCLVLASVGGIPDAHRNIVRAFAANYMRLEYGEGSLLVSRARHAARVLRRGRDHNVAQLFDSSVR